ncbi:hypothetical protein DL96DRAFT_1824384 [Flagelloscypha sp. PMI_526]|nr:hypothetical protein DL96DRAFT_1824384 [Flagelloscypha sp. PMI_526]
MAQNFIWPGKLFYYPIGNTAAVSLIRDLDPDEDAALLLLGCGDPRNILFSIYSEAEGIDRKLDFTCVDWDPAVLARNVLLFTLVIDKKPLNGSFDIFYHPYLDQATLDLLVSQCRTLATCSANMKTWRESKYGDAIHMSTECTLVELRSLWVKYASMHSLPQAQLTKILTTFKKEFKSTGNTGAAGAASTSRSAGPLMDRASTSGTLTEAFKGFWRTGTTFTDLSSISAATLLNPTFVYSRAGVGIGFHYGSDPLMGFHLVPAFGHLPDAKRSDVLEIVRAEFQSWCLAFQSNHSRRLCTIRIFFSDALLACAALKMLNSTGTYQTGVPAIQWKTHTILFEEEEYRHAPKSFDVVDTSNLDDHVGLLNILVAAIPLLRSSGRATLYLESLLHIQDDAVNDFTARLLADLSLMSTLFGMCPVDFATGYSSRSNVHELLLFDAMQRSVSAGKIRSQFHQVTTWKRVDDGVLPCQYQPHQLGTFLYDLYHSLFEIDDSTTFHAKHRVNLPTAIAKRGNEHYTRESFVLFLKLVRDRHCINPEDWISVMDRFFTVHSADHSMPMDTVNHHDLYASLYRHGVHAVDAYRTDILRPVGVFKAWPFVPPIVRVFITVPRSKLEVFASRPSTPTLVCTVQGPRNLNVFASIHASYGIVTRKGTPAKPSVFFEEDLHGIQGSKPLVLSFVMPARLLTGQFPGYDDPSSLSVTFAVKNNPANVALFVDKLGPMMDVHSVSLMDTQNVIVIPEHPPPSASLSPIKHTTKTGGIGGQGAVTVVMDPECELVENMSVRLTVTEKNIQPAYQARTITPIVEQVSLSTLRITLGDKSQDVCFPLPIAGAKHNLRIARKFLWIEIIVPPQEAVVKDGSRPDPFPIVPNAKTPIPWTIHRLCLDLLPTVDLKAKMLEEWMGLHLGVAFSKRELKTRKNRSTQSDALIYVKESIYQIMICATGLSSQSTSSQHIFCLTDKATSNFDTVIFVDQIRYDLSAHTIVCDAYVLPLTRKLRLKIDKNLDRAIYGWVKPDFVQLGKGEIASWKRLLPVLAERCRSWKHQSTCEYIQKDGSLLVPLSDKVEEKPLCSCGEAQDVAALERAPNWKSLAKYCTRIALSPIFGVSYLEKITRTDRRCTVCRARAKMICPECKKDRYCGKPCQKKDWKRHKGMYHDPFEIKEKK